MKNSFKIGLLGLSAALVFAQCTSNKSEVQTEDMPKVEDVKTPSLTKLWETPETLITNESVLFDASTGTIYVANIEGDPTDKDGVGSISIIDNEGNIVNQDWVTGLDAPKGMGITNGNLYVTDIDQVVEINLESAKVTNKYPVQGAKFLNDVATYEGKVYFTDMHTGMMHLLEDGKLSVISEKNESINGIAIDNDGKVYGLDSSGLKLFNEDGTSTIINANVKGGDGLVILGDDNYVASKWAGEIYFISGETETLLLDTKAEESNTADIGYIPEERLLLVPTFMKNKVVGYKLDY